MGRKGSAIIIVLLISAVAFTVAFFLIGVVKRMNFVSQSLVDKLNAKLEAESSVEKLIFGIASGEFHQNYVSLFIDGLPERVYLDGRWHSLNNNTQVSTMDASSKFYLFNIPYSAVKRLLLLMENETLALTFYQSLIDWCDKDDFERVNGAERLYYGSEGVAYVPRNYMAIQSEEELGIIRGLMDLDEDLKVKIESFFVSYGSPFVNLNTADENVISAVLDIPVEMARMLIAVRNKNGALINSDLKRLFNISLSDSYITLFPNKCIILTVKSEIRSAVERLKVVIDFNQDSESPYRVLEWRE